MSKPTTFEFATANRIIFGAGKVAQTAEIAASLGTRTLIVASANSESAANTISQQLSALQSSAPILYAISGEPDVATIENGVEAARSAGCDVVIGIGGGSVIDAGKAIAGLLTNGGSVLDYVEVVGAGKPITKPAAPYIAIPTTAGTGAEVTRNAVISVKDRHVKVSMRSPHLLPTVALIDPELTYSMPPEVTASTGVDALTQLIEAYTCNRVNVFTDALAMSGLSKAVKSLVIAYNEGTPQSREDMAYASLCSGLALANAGLGAVHGFAAVLGGRYPIPHGVCCAALLPHVVRGNIAALSARERQNPTIMRYIIIANLLAGGKDGGQQLLDKLVSQLTEICQTLHIPSLSAYGVTGDDVPDLVAQAQQASSMKANPIVLTPEELSQILLAAL